MAIVKRIEYKGQGIQIIQEGLKFSCVILCFPKDRSNVAVSLRTGIIFDTITETIRRAKDRIAPEVDNGNWVAPQKPLDILFNEHYEHED